MAVWISADYHFNHDKEFIWKPRGFSCVEEMNQTIISRHNSIIAPNDEVFLLGDLMLGDIDRGVECLHQLNGYITVIRGNHDTDNRIAAYNALDFEVCDAKYLKYNKYHFYLSHFPSFTANLEKESLKQCTCNLYGHTHQQTNFYNEIPFMYHVGVDSHNCYPINLDSVISDMEAKVQECKNLL